MLGPGLGARYGSGPPSRLQAKEGLHTETCVDTWSRVNHQVAAKCIYIMPQSSPMADRCIDCRIKSIYMSLDLVHLGRLRACSFFAFPYLPV